MIDGKPAANAAAAAIAAAFVDDDGDNVVAVDDATDVVVEVVNADTDAVDDERPSIELDMDWNEWTSLSKSINNGKKMGIRKPWKTNKII